MASSSSKETVLITGVNGYIGYATAVKTLEVGYKVRAVVRRQDAIDYVQARGTSIQRFEKSGQLEWSILPDMGDKEGFAAAAKGCSYIVHIAFPLGNRPGNLHEVAMSGLNALLHAAEQNSSVKRIVWTSSSGGICKFEDLLHDSPRNKALLAGGADAANLEPLSGETQIDLPTNVNETSPPFVWYQYGKIAATNALRAYSLKPSPSTHQFDIIIVFPGWTLGPNELNKTRTEALDGKGTNSFLLFMYRDFNYNFIIGKKPSDEPWIPAAFVHIDDVAEGHVNALTIGVPQGRLRNFLLCSDAPSGPVADSALEIVREHFPKEAERLYEDARYSMFSRSQHSRCRANGILQRRYP